MQSITRTPDLKELKEHRLCRDSQYVKGASGTATNSYNTQGGASASLDHLYSAGAVGGCGLEHWQQQAQRHLGHSALCKQRQDTLILVQARPKKARKLRLAAQSFC